MPAPPCLFVACAPSGSRIHPPYVKLFRKHCPAESTRIVERPKNQGPEQLQTELGRQQERAAKAELELLRQGARENLLAGAVRSKLIGSLKPFAGQSAEGRFGRSKFGILQKFPEPAGSGVMGP